MLKNFGLMLVTVAGVLVMGGNSLAQVVTFDTSSLTNATSTNPTFNATQVAAGIVPTPQLSRTTLTAGNGANGSFSSTGANITNTFDPATHYVGFTVTPNGSTAIFAKSITWSSKGGNTSPNIYATAYSTDGFVTNNNLQTGVNTSIMVQARSFDITDLITNNSLNVRLYNFGAGSLGNGQNASSQSGSFEVITPAVTGSTISTAAGAIALTANTEVRTSTSLTLGGNISGGFGLTKLDVGTLRLSGVNSYTGSTTAGAGTLLINSTGGSGTGAVDVSTGGTLGGTGSVTGATTVSTGGTLLGGEGTAVNQTLTTGSVTLGNNSNLRLVVANGAGQSDQTIGGASRIASTSTFNRDGGALTKIFLTNDGSLVIGTEYTRRLVTYGSTTTFTNGNFTSGNSEFTVEGTNFNVGSNWTVIVGTGFIDVTFTPVPEPGTLLALGAAGLGLLGAIRRNRGRKATVEVVA